MNSNQNNKLAMYLAVQKVCHAFSAVWSVLAAFASAFAGFETGISKINSSLETQGKNINGVSEDKKNLKTKLAGKALEIAGAIFAFASDAGKMELKSSVKFSKTSLEHKPDSVTLNSCRLISDQAVSIQALLVNYGVSVTDISDFQAMITDFELSIASPRVAITTRKSATSDISNIFRNTDSVMKNKMDKLMEKFKLSNPDFYKQYHDARIIVDHGLHHLKVEPPAATVS